MMIVVVRSMIVVVIVISIVTVLLTGRYTTRPYSRVEADNTVCSYEAVSIRTAINGMITRVIAGSVNLSIMWRLEFWAFDFCIIIIRRE